MNSIFSARIKRLMVVIAFCFALLTAALIAVIVLHSPVQPLVTPDVSVVASSVELSVKAVERKAEPMAQAAVAGASAAVAIVCGADEASAVRYEARSKHIRRNKFLVQFWIDSHS